MTTGLPNPPPFPLARSAARLGVVAAAGIAVTAGVALGLGRADHALIAVVCGAWCGGVSILALLPVRWRSGSGPEGVAQGFLLGLMIRMMLCLGAAAALGFATPLPLVPVCLWMCGWYLLLLVVEVVILTRHLARPTAAATPGA